MAMLVPLLVMVAIKFCLCEGSHSKGEDVNEKFYRKTAKQIIAEIIHFVMVCDSSKELAFPFHSNKKRLKIVKRNYMTASPI